MDHDDLPLTTDSFFWTTTLASLGLGIGALLVGWVVSLDVRESIPSLDPTDISPVLKGIFWGLMAAVPMFLVMQLIKRIPLAAIQDLERLSEEEFTHAMLSLRPVQMALIGLCSGIGEELLFRGLLMPGISEWFEWRTKTLGITNVPALLPVVIGLVVSSILFGAVHSITKAYVVISGLMGLYLGGLMLYWDNLLVPITAHAVYNTTEMLLGKYLNDPT